MAMAFTVRENLYLIMKEITEEATFECSKSAPLHGKAHLFLQFLYTSFNIFLCGKRSEMESLVKKRLLLHHHRTHTHTHVHAIQFDFED